MPHLDHWLTLESNHGDRLFGYVDHHPRIGGKSWMVTSPVREYRGNSVVTHSGTVYRLGHEVADPEQLPTDEAKIALQLLLDRDSGIPYDQVLALWLTACKMSRWLDLEPPERTDKDALKQFIGQHAVAYLQRFVAATN
jgi:hypothetical protein